MASEEVTKDAKMSDEQHKPLTALQKARLENNRQKALQLRKAKAAIEAETKRKTSEAKKRIQQSVAIPVDSGAGFFIDEDDEPSKKKIAIKESEFVIGADVPCDECTRPFNVSFLRTNFDLEVCDECRDREVHVLITKSNAKLKYLLKDEDFEKREPPLKCIVKRNPRNNHWGEMKLYLESQCYDRAMEIWESMEAIEEEITKRKILSAKARSKKFDKKMKDLKMEVRSSLYKKDLAAHTHEYGEEMYNEKSDEYSKTCQTCNLTITYEKM